MLEIGNISKRKNRKDRIQRDIMLDDGIQKFGQVLESNTGMERIGKIQIPITP